VGILNVTCRLAVTQACWFWFIAVKQADGLWATWGWRLYAGVFSCGGTIGLWLCHSLVRSVLYSTKTAAGFYTQLLCHTLIFCFYHLLLTACGAMFQTQSGF
jgi:hypothetical protein